MSLRHAAVLARLTELGLALAERVQAEAMAATGADELDRMSQAFHRVSRSVRMSVALEAKLARAERDEARVREDADPPRQPIDREFINVIVTPTWTVDENGEEVPGPPTYREYEAPDWTEDTKAPEAKISEIKTSGIKTPATGRADLARAEDTAAEAAALAARIAFVKSELACEFGPQYAEAHAAAIVGEAIRAEEDRARALRGDTS
jgi:hypothetical protein